MTDWFVVYTRSGAEKTALENLQRQGFEAYLPMCRRRRSHARRVDIVKRPLFPRYLFIAIDRMRDRWRPILGTMGVCDLLRRGETPTRVPEGVVDAIRASESANAFDDPDPAATFQPGQKVRVMLGPYAELIGRFQSAIESERVLVLLDLFGQEVRARIPKGDIVSA
ncbi:MAG: transcriptional activator RfaH [Tagaea sp. CACIAM 22H2]|nr:transcriptional activator RfaH [Tagaea sp. CACIAM 22H2]